MVVPINTAINAYNSVAKSMGMQGMDDGGATNALATGSGPSFSDFFQSSIENAIQVEHKGEDVSAKALVGKASANDVVVAMTNAEMTLQEVSKIRDQVVSAYEDILKMPI